MDITNTFLPVAKELIQNVFPTSIRYLRDAGSSYDPASGEVTPNITQFDIAAGVLSRGRTEQGGVGEDYELRLWIDHSATGLPHLPTTADRVEYGGLTWKVSAVDPSYSSTGLIASKLICKHS